MSTNTPALPGLGETLHGVAGTINTSDYGSSVGLEGSSKVFNWTDPTDRLKKDNRQIHAIFVRNTSGITLMGKLAVTWSTTAGERGKRVTGYSETKAVEIAGIVDDRLPVTGVRNGDMFWLIVKGPVLVLTALAEAAANALTVGDLLFAATAAASTAVTTGGTTADEGGGFTIDDGTVTQTETTDGGARNEFRNAYGVAMSSSTSGNTKTARLIDVNVLTRP